MINNKKRVYFFSNSLSEGSFAMKDLLGSKGAILHDMCLNKLPVPAGFVITTEQCKLYYENSCILSNELRNDIFDYIKKLESETGKTFGDETNFPLLVSVRSGASISMPGMMDTILNLGLTSKTLISLKKNLGNLSALDCYRRFIQMYSSIVLEIPMHYFDLALNDLKLDLNIKNESEFQEEHLEELIEAYFLIIKYQNKVFPDNHCDQLLYAIESVFKSWNNARAIKYRKINNISDDLYTAVTIQSMVFGNINDNSGTGVVFTRNVANGENEIYGEYMQKAQGEDIVAGIRTPVNINSLKVLNFDLYHEIESKCKLLENYYKNVQDIEFTVENGKFWLLQSRNAKRNAKSAIKIAYDLHKEGLLTKQEAINTIDPKTLDSLFHVSLKDGQILNIIGKGLGSSDGIAIGKVMFDSESAEALIKKTGEKVILVRHETSAEDIGCIYLAQGILTSTGGMTSHAAVIARGIGKPSVCGCTELEIDYNSNCFILNGHIVKEGDIISIDGTTGSVILGFVEIQESLLPENFYDVLSWAKEVSKIDVRVNAETEFDIVNGLKFGALGIGLARTEHMFFHQESLSLLRKVILSSDEFERKNYLDQLMEYHSKDFENIFKANKNNNTNIRLIDPPLHEFLPRKKEELEKLSNEMSLSLKELESIIKKLDEVNPMLGHRGSRVGVSFPEIYAMQIDAIIDGFLKTYEYGDKSRVEIMLPLVINLKETQYLQELIRYKFSTLSLETKEHFSIGSMIELPAACFNAGEIASVSDYLSFGTNDLTQTTLGLSRDDAGKFLGDYLEKNIISSDPFKVIADEVIEIMQIAISKAKKINPKIKLGICGEHGGDPDSIKKLKKLGIDYVSCSPYRVPIAIISCAINKE